MTKDWNILLSGNLSGVIECFRNALYFYPNFAEVHNTIGMIQFQIEKYEGAIQLFDNALAMNPNFAEAYNNRSIYQYLRQKKSMKR